MRVFLSTVNITEQGTYCKRNSHFSFSHHMSEANASYRNGSGDASYCEEKRNNASSSGFYEAFCGAAAKYEAQLTLHEAALRAMKRSLTVSCFFAQWAKKWSGGVLIVRKTSLNLKKVAS